MNWIVDTNLISELHRPRPHPGVKNWFSETPIEHLFITTLNLAEIRYGVRVQSDPERAKAIERWLEEAIRPMFAERVFEADERALTEWRALSSMAQKRGRPAPPADLLVAAIALVNGCAVVTRDAGPFAAAGLPVFNPWTNERLNLD